MERLVVRFENCYGIKRLSCSFDFSKGNVHAVYAPNGFMKTSFALALRDLSEGKSTGDRMFPNKVTRREIVDETGATLPGDNVLVIPPYEPEFRQEPASVLLVNQDLKRQYEVAVALLDAEKDALLKSLKARSGVTGRTVTPETELLACFGGQTLFDCLGKMILASKSPDDALALVPYDIVFNDKAVAFLQGDSALADIKAYIETFDNLVSQSAILNTKFTHTNAQAVQKSLVDTSFFEAGHWVTLSDADTKTEIRDPGQFKARMDDEFKRIFSDRQLRAAFDALDKRLSGNADLRKLRDYLREHPEIVARMSDLDALKRAIWGGHLHAESEQLFRLVSQFEASRRTIRDVVLAARAQATDWAEVVDLFNTRFAVPFTVAVQNQADVILKAAAPSVSFTFRDEDGAVAPATHDALLRVLSQGEKRALYLLNVLFEVRVRQKSGRPHLVVVDDIADSFDYRNKYAIIEYLQDVARTPRFRLIVLTHNYDFHRAVASRLDLPYDNRRIAARSTGEVSLLPENYQRKSPITAWMKQKENTRMFLASIPFARNLAEYCQREDAYGVLTSALHLKEDTKGLTLADLDREYAKVIHGYSAPSSPPRSALFWDLLNAEASAIADELVEHAGLEAKVILSIAIRLRGEEHMISRFTDAPFVYPTGNQTPRLLKRYRETFSETSAAQIRVLEQVQLMTPENIHLNSFMYEPILDLGTAHLKRLYTEVCSL